MDLMTPRLGASAVNLSVVVADDAAGVGDALILRALDAHPRDRVAVLDGGNRFNPYALARAAQARGRPPRELLSRVLVSRAFTCFQMDALVARPLPAPRAVVLSMLDLFLEEEIAFSTAQFLLRRAAAALARLDAVCVEWRPTSWRAERLLEILASHAAQLQSVP